MKQKRRTLPIWKFKFWRALYWVTLMLRRPVVLSIVAPVADWYLDKASINNLLG